MLHEGKTTEQSIGTDKLTPLIQELLLGSLRHLYSLEAQVDPHLKKPFRDKDRVLYALLLVGAYQLLYLRVPDHAAINETVGAVNQLKKPWARGLVNAVLRAVARQRDETTPFEHSFELPEWIVDQLKQDFPAQAEAIGRASTERAPMSLRVNTQRTTPEAYQQLLQDAGVSFHGGYFPEQLILTEPVPVRELPGHEEGLVSIQDAGAQFAARLVDDLPITGPERILDACAAPGGKLFHLAERFPEAALTGLEISAERLEHLQAEARRLGHDKVNLVQGDATDLDWFEPADQDADNDRDPGTPGFDLILLDAPCTGTGTLRRHPDIKVLRTPDDVTAAAQLQVAMLRNLWPLVRPGGCLIYCTCSLFAEENDQVLEAFLAEPGSGAPGAEVANRTELPTGIPTRHGWQLLPLPAEDEVPNRTVDGFYFAIVTRQETRREKAR